MNREGRHDSTLVMLHRIVAMLFSLSALAHRSTNRSRLVRRMLCWILAIILSPIREMIVETAHDVGLHPDFADLDFSSSNDSAEDLMRFAWALGELGRTLQHLIVHIELLAPDERDRAQASVARRVVACLAAIAPAFESPALRVPCPDTS